MQSQNRNTMPLIRLDLDGDEVARVEKDGHL
jgi:hypothetical protein